LQFTINGDKAVEPNETFVVNLSNPIGGVLADNQAVVTITNDDFVRLWQNPVLAMDVNNNGNITGLDALIIINRLNTVGSGVLPSQPPPPPYFFYDVNGDNNCTPIDALIIINELNRRAQQDGGAMAAASSGESTALELATQADDQPGPAPAEHVTSEVAGDNDADAVLAVRLDEPDRQSTTGVIRTAPLSCPVGTDDADDLTGPAPPTGNSACSVADLLATAARTRAVSDFWAEFA
jgi:dockerin type I repeat protein